MMRETWNNDGAGIVDYAQGNRREFRYDAGRQRYMDAPLDEFLNVVHTATEWMDYDGDQPYHAFSINASNQLWRLEAWEPGHWKGWNESKLNQLGDIYVAGKGWIDAQL